MRLALARFTLPAAAVVHATRAARALRLVPSDPRPQASEPAQSSAASEPEGEATTQVPRPAFQPIVLTYDQPPLPRPARRGVRVRRAMSESGRMVISGRMDEVCAELERLARCEAAASA